MRLKIKQKAVPGRYLNFVKTLILLVFFWYSLPTEVLAQNTTYEWKSLAIGGGGFVSAVIPSKTEAGLVYARTDVGGAYRWDNTAAKWVPLMDWVSQDETGLLGVESIALDPTASNKVYILAGTSYFNNGKTVILRSSDYGNTFTITNVTTQFKAHGNGMGRQTGEKLVVDPNNSNILYCGTRANGLFKSTDAGATWARLSGLNVNTTPNENGISFVVLDPKNKNASGTQTIYVGVSAYGTNMYKSTDGGQTFNPVTGAPTTFMPMRAVLASDDNLVITYANGAGPHGNGNAALNEPTDAGQIWKLNTPNSTWTNITPSGISRAFSGISIDPNNSQRMVATTINTYMLQEGNAYGDRIFLSTNGGSSWTDLVARGFDLDPNGITWINGHSIHWAGSIEFDPFDAQKAWVTSGNGIFKTDNINATTNVWKFFVKGLEETVPLNIISVPDGPLVTVIGDYDGFRHIDIAEYAPIHTPRIGTTTGLAFAPQNTNVMLRAGDKIYSSADKGKTWTERTINGKKGQVAISANGSVFLQSPEASSTTYRSTTNGASWTTVSGLNFNEARPVADYVNTNKFYAYNASTGYVMVSTNAGTSFSNGANMGTGGSKVLRTTPGKEGHVWLAMYNNGLHRSINSGQSFSKESVISYCGAVGFGKEALGSSYPTIYIWGTINNVMGVYRSTDEGQTWLRVNDDEHEYGGPGNGQFVMGDMNVFGRVYMSTVGRGVVYGQVSGTTTVTGIKQYNPLELIYGANPFTNGFFIQAPKSFQYKINSLVGSELESGSAKGRATVGVKLEPGLYILSVWNGNQVSTLKIIKK